MPRVTPLARRRSGLGFTGKRYFDGGGNPRQSQNRLKRRWRLARRNAVIDSGFATLSGVCVLRPGAAMAGCQRISSCPLTGITPYGMGDGIKLSFSHSKPPATYVEPAKLLYHSPSSPAGSITPASGWKIPLQAGRGVSDTDHRGRVVAFAPSRSNISK